MGAEKEIKFRNHEIIYTETEKSSFMYYVQSGSVELYLNAGNSVVSLVTLGQGEWLGEMGFFADLPRTVNARAKGRTTLIQVKRTQDVQLEMKHTPDWLLHCYKSTLKRLRAAYLKLQKVGDNAVTIDYGTIRKKALSKAQTQELLGTLILVNMTINTNKFDNMGAQCIDYNDIMEMLGLFYPNFSLGYLRMKEFLIKLGVLRYSSTISLKKDCFEIGELYPLKGLVNFLKYVRSKNLELITLRDRELEVLEAVIMLAQVKMQHDEDEKKERAQAAFSKKIEKDPSVKPYDPLILDMLDRELNLSGEEDCIGASEDDIEDDKREIMPDNRFVQGDDGIREDRYWIKYPEEVIHEYFIRKEKYSGSLTHTKRLEEKKLIVREVDPRSAKVYLLVSLGELTDTLPFIRLIEDFVNMRAV